MLPLHFSTDLGWMKNEAIKQMKKAIEDLENDRVLIYSFTYWPSIDTLDESRTFSFELVKGPNFNAD